MPRLSRDSVTWLVYAQLGVWGYFAFGFGAVVPLLRDEQHVSRGVASLHSVALAAGAMASGAIFLWLTRRYGRGPVLWLGLAGEAVGAVAFCLFRPVVLTVVCALLLSTFSYLVLNGVVSGLSEKHGPAGTAAIAEANALGCAVGALAPLAIGASVAAGLTWRPAVAGTVVLVAGVAVVARFLGVRLDFSPANSGLPPDPLMVPTASPVPAVPGRLPRAYRLAWALLCCTGSIEACVILWSGDVLRTHAGMAADTAAGAVSGIVGGMCLGRVVLGQLALRIPPAQLMLGAFGVSLAGFAVFWAATVPWVAVCGLMICGLGNGMQYPLAIGMALDVSGGRPDLAAARAAYTMGIGFGVAPFALGAVADRIGPRPAFLFVPVLIGAATVLVVLLGRRLNANPPGVRGGFDSMASATS